MFSKCALPRERVRLHAPEPDPPVPPPKEPPLPGPVPEREPPGPASRRSAIPRQPHGMHLPCTDENRDGCSVSVTNLTQLLPREGPPGILDLELIACPGIRLLLEIVP